MIEEKKNYRPGEVYKVDLHGWHGNVIDRAKFKTTERSKAALAVKRIIDNCDLTFHEIEEANIQEYNELMGEPIKRPFSKDSWKLRG